MDDLIKTVELQQKASHNAVEKLHEQLRLDQQLQNLNSLEELRLDQDKTTIFESEKQQVLEQLRSIGNITVAQLEYLLAKAGAVGDARVLAVVRALLEEKRIGVGALAYDVVKVIETVDFDTPQPHDQELVKKIKCNFPRGIEVLRF